ncbi:hypothetical protein TWF694_008950 [Orbilia ellipsospora]|uniref:Uncharacterized protein n=1 Tax=Orbilia ellipsospora TaxID=2528407 RepID=A0AAV9XDE6_9PEZI
MTGTSKPYYPRRYKFVVFKNAMTPGDWDSANVHAFDQKKEPIITKDANSILILAEFCDAALGAICNYLGPLNQNVDKTPLGYTWNITSVYIVRDSDGVLSCREFAIVLELVNCGDELFGMLQPNRELSMVTMLPDGTQHVYFGQRRESCSTELGGIRHSS